MNRARLRAPGPVAEAFTRAKTRPRPMAAQAAALRATAAPRQPRCLAEAGRDPVSYNTLVVLAGCALLGVAAGTVGIFALLRGRALVADAVGHAALPGVAVAALIVALLGADPRALPPLLAGAAVAGLLGVLAVQALTRTRRIREDAAIAIVLSSFYAAGVALLSWLQTLPGAAQAGLSQIHPGPGGGDAGGGCAGSPAASRWPASPSAGAFQRLRAVCLRRRLRPRAGAARRRAPTCCCSA